MLCYARAPVRFAPRCQQSSTAAARPEFVATSTAMKRSAAEPALKKAKKVAAPKQSQPELPPVACIISGLHAECKIAVAKCLLQELEAGRAVLLTTDAAAAKKALPGSKVRQFSGLSKSAGLLAKSLAGDGRADGDQSQLR